jgi:hypothetical protein
MGLRLEYKAPLTAPAPVATDTGDEGIVIAIVGVTGVQDQVDDVVLPGAYTKTLGERRPKVCWAHSWEDPVGRILHIEEIPPGDRRLPAQTKDGRAWPAGAGALVATMQFNLDSERGREAWAAVKFFSKSGEADWSIGYQVPPGQSTRRSDGVRMIKALDLYEISFVLHGAAAQTMTLDLKAAVSLMHGLERKDSPEGTGHGVPGTDPDDPFGELLGGPAADAGPGDGADGELDEAGWAQVDALSADDDDLDDDLDVPVDEAKILGTPDWAPEVKRSFTAARRRELAQRGHAMPGGQFPIETRADVANAVRAFGRASTADRAKVKAHIMRRARALGCLDAVPDDWKRGKALDAVLTLEAKYDTAPLGTGHNWVTARGGLPPFIRAVAHALIRSGHDESRAIQLAIAAIRRWASGGGHVTEKTREKARAALARWEALKASTKGWDPLLEVGPAAGCRRAEVKGRDVPAEAKGYPAPRLAGTWEERSDALRDAVDDLLVTRGEPDDDGYRRPDCWVCIVGTYDDRVVVHVEGRGADEAAATTLEIPYTWTVDGGVVLGEPQEVRLQVTVADDTTTPDDGDDDAAGVAADEDEPMLVLPMVLDHAAFAAKILTGRLQGKAGRVLSGMNADRIRDAVRTLIAVLAAAGVDLTAAAPAPAPGAAPAGPPQEDTMATKAIDDDHSAGDGDALDPDELARWSALAAAVNAIR